MSQAGGVANQQADYADVHKPFLSMSCMDAQTQHEMDECGSKSLVSATQKMQQIFEHLKINYTANEPGLVKFLLHSQETWIKYQQASCKLETYYSRDGSGFNSIWNACLEQKINERISHLNWLIDNP